jgi:hypothetical protein
LRRTAFVAEFQAREGIIVDDARVEAGLHSGI